MSGYEQCGGEKIQNDDMTQKSSEKSTNDSTVIIMNPKYRPQTNNYQPVILSPPYGPHAATNDTFITTTTENISRGKKK